MTDLSGCAANAPWRHASSAQLAITRLNTRQRWAWVIVWSSQGWGEWDDHAQCPNPRECPKVQSGRAFAGLEENVRGLWEIIPPGIHGQVLRSGLFRYYGVSRRHR